MSRGRTWMKALAGDAVEAPVPSVLCADCELEGETTRFLAVVPDPESPFQRARNGELGLREAWTLARLVREAVESDLSGSRRAIVAVVDLPGQAYGRLEETAALHLALAAASDAYATARLAGHPVVALIVGEALSGGFLAHGFQANRILALDDPGVTVHAMHEEAAARVTMRTVADLRRLADSVPPLAFDAATWASLGMCEPLIGGVDVEDPGPDDVRTVRQRLAASISEARDSPRDLSVRLASEGARENRQASIAVRAKLAEQWC
ncbi:MAG TPA: biotin-independent malonate decarboxylase subunit gamma [Rubrobacter sp.]